MIAYKVTRSDGTDLRTGTVRYAVGEIVECPDAEPAEAGLCRRGLHVSLTLHDAIQCCRQIDDSHLHRPWRLHEVEIETEDVPRVEKRVVMVKNP